MPTASTTSNSSTKPATRRSAPAEADAGTVPVFSSDGKNRMATISRRVFQKTITGSVHFLRTPPAIAMDKYAHDFYKDQFDSIEITDREPKEGGRKDKWTISRADFEAHAILLNRKFGDQYAVPFCYWSKNGAAPVGTCQVGKTQIGKPSASHNEASPAKAAKPQTGLLFDLD